MKIIRNTTDIIELCKNDIEKVAEYYLITAILNRVLLAIIIALIIFIVINYKKRYYRLDMTDERKLIKICKIESREVKQQTKHVIKKFIEEYEKEHNLEWDEWREEYK